MSGWIKNKIFYTKLRDVHYFHSMRKVRRFASFECVKLNFTHSMRKAKCFTHTIKK